MSVAPSRLSKSNYLKGNQCKKALWFSRHRKDLSPQVDEYTQNRFDQGNEIGILAQSLFPDGALMDLEYYQIKESHKKTIDLIKSGIKTIFEATVYDDKDDLIARADVAILNDDNTWELIEVKSSMSVKPEHISDLAFQYYVFSKRNYKISKCSVLYLNKEYIKNGEIDASKLFKMEDITKEVINLQDDLKSLIKEYQLTLSTKEEPLVKIGPHCNKPYECDYKSLCWKDVPDYSILNLFISSKSWKIVQELNSYKIEDLPKENLPIKEKLIDYNSYIKEKNNFEPDKIKQFLNTIQYPIYFLDYETICTSIPLFDASKPYQQVPFQFSLHKQETESSKIEHFEFLHTEKTDPRPSLIDSLIQECGDEGSILVYYESFEKSRNNELIDFAPEYKNEIEAINNRIVDLYIPFKKRWAYSPKQKSSASIKAVLPAFTDINYKHLKIGRGDKASLEYLNFLLGKQSEDELKEIFVNLKEYCKLDTFAMVKLLKFLETKQAYF